MGISRFFDMPFVYINQQIAIDDFGGRTVVNVDGETFSGGMIQKASLPSVTGDVSTTSSEYILCFVGVKLQPGDKIKRVDSGAVYEVVSVPIEAPAVASILAAHSECTIKVVSV